LSDTARLLGVTGEMGPYVALSHCWGGDVPCKLLDSNLKEYKTVGLPVDALPQNSKDAIEVTRELGIRYLWIDALCIIQDSKPDWKTEAVRMVDYYANARVTVTALDANSSRDGFLSRNHQGPVQISPGLAIQRLPLSLSRTPEKCPLETRGWCLQEQLLSPAVLHFSKEQVFWECQMLVRSESEGMDANVVNNLSPGGRVNSSSFDRIAMRNSLATSASGSNTLDHMNWNSRVEEYTRRKLTFGTNKLPALSAIAHRFRYARDSEEDARPASEPGYYAAGLWTHNIARGILWRPQLQMALRSNAGYTQTVSTLSRPPGEPLAPSWSWTSVDGPVEFYGQKAQSNTEKVIIDPAILTIASVDMSVCRDGLTTTKTQGRLAVRGPVVKMEYWPPGSRMDVLQSEQKFAGSLFLGEKRAFNTVVMDVERDKRRDCWVMITAREKLALLILDQVEAGQNLYRRVGSGVSEEKISDEILAMFTKPIGPQSCVNIL
jgi:hypothetical protein